MINETKETKSEDLFGQDALEASRMVAAHAAIVETNSIFGTIVMFRAGSSTFDASLLTTVVRKSTKDKDKISPFGPAIGGLPKNKEFGRRKTDKESFGQLYEYKGNSDVGCHVQQTLPLGFVLSDFINGTYKLMNPVTGISVSYARKEGQSEQEHNVAMRECLEHVRSTKQICFMLDKVPEEYTTLKNLNYVYKFDLAAGEKSIQPENISKQIPSTVKEFWASFLPESSITDHYPESYATVENAAADKFEKLEIYAKKIMIDGELKSIRKSSDEDRLANAVDPDSTMGKLFVELIPDADETVNTFDRDYAYLARETLAGEVLNLTRYIQQLKTKLTTESKSTDEITKMISVFEKIHTAFTDSDSHKLESLYEIVGNAGRTTKREFFWQLYANILLHKDAPHYLYLIQHGNENQNPGIPSEIDRTVIQSAKKGEAVLAGSEESFVTKLITSPDYKNIQMYLNPKWIFDAESKPKETKVETISAYKPKGYLWGAVVQGQMNAGNPVEVDVLISYSHYLQTLKQELSSVNAFGSLHSHADSMSFPALKQKHLILKNSGISCSKEAALHIDELLAKAQQQVFKQLQQDLTQGTSRLKQASEAKEISPSKVCLILHKMNEKLKQISPLVALPHFKTLIKKAIISGLGQANLDVVKFANDTHFKYAIESGDGHNTQENIKNLLSQIKDEYTKIFSVEKSEGITSSIFKEVKESKGEKHTDSESEDEDDSDSDIDGITTNRRT